MNAQKRFEQQRPFAARVDHSGRFLSENPMPPNGARTLGLFAIAHALLDVSDAIRELSSKGGRDEDR